MYSPGGSTVEVGSEVYSEEALTPMLASYANMYFEI